MSAATTTFCTRFSNYCASEGVFVGGGLNSESAKLMATLDESIVNIGNVLFAMGRLTESELNLVVDKVTKLSDDSREKVMAKIAAIWSKVDVAKLTGGMFNNVINSHLAAFKGSLSGFYGGAANTTGAVEFLADMHEFIGAAGVEVGTELKLKVESLVVYITLLEEMIKGHKSLVSKENMRDAFITEAKIAGDMLKSIKELQTMIGASSSEYIRSVTKMALEGKLSGIKEAAKRGELLAEDKKRIGDLIKLQGKAGIAAEKLHKALHLLGVNMEKFRSLTNVAEITKFVRQHELEVLRKYSGKDKAKRLEAIQAIESYANDQRHGAKFNADDAFVGGDCGCVGDLDGEFVGGKKRKHSERYDAGEFKSLFEGGEFMELDKSVKYDLATESNIKTYDPLKRAFLEEQTRHVNAMLDAAVAAAYALKKKNVYDDGEILYFLHRLSNLRMVDSGRMEAFYTIGKDYNSRFVRDEIVASLKDMAEAGKRIEAKVGPEMKKFIEAIESYRRFLMDFNVDQKSSAKMTGAGDGEYLTDLFYGGMLANTLNDVIDVFNKSIVLSRMQNGLNITIDELKNFSKEQDGVNAKILSKWINEYNVNFKKIVDNMAETGAGKAAECFPVTEALFKRVLQDNLTGVTHLLHAVQAIDAKVRTAHLKVIENPAAAKNLADLLSKVAFDTNWITDDNFTAFKDFVDFFHIESIGDNSIVYTQAGTFNVLYSVLGYPVTLGRAANAATANVDLDVAAGANSPDAAYATIAANRLGWHIATQDNAGNALSAEIQADYVAEHNINTYNANNYIKEAKRSPFPYNMQKCLKTHVSTLVLCTRDGKNCDTESRNKLRESRQSNYYGGKTIMPAKTTDQFRNNELGWYTDRDGNAVDGHDYQNAAAAAPNTAAADTATYLYNINTPVAIPRHVKFLDVNTRGSNYVNAQAKLREGADTVLMLRNLFSVFSAIDKAYGAEDATGKAAGKMGSIYNAIKEYLVLTTMYPTIYELVGTNTTKSFAAGHIAMREFGHPIVSPFEDTDDINCYPYGPELLGDLERLTLREYYTGEQIHAADAKYIGNPFPTSNAVLNTSAGVVAHNVSWKFPDYHMTRTGWFREMFAKCDMLLIMSIKSMFVKIMSTLSMFKVINFDTNSSLQYNKLRIIYGGGLNANIHSSNIISENTEIYIRIFYYMIFLKDLFFEEKNVSNNFNIVASAKRMALLPDTNGKFSDLMKLFFIKWFNTVFTWKTSVSNVDQKINDMDINSYIDICNIIAEGYSGNSREKTEKIIKDLVTDVNRRYGLVNTDEILKKMNSSKLNMYPQLARLQKRDDVNLRELRKATKPSPSILDGENDYIDLNIPSKEKEYTNTLIGRATTLIKPIPNPGEYDFENLTSSVYNFRKKLDTLTEGLNDKFANQFKPQSEIDAELISLDTAYKVILAPTKAQTDAYLSNRKKLTYVGRAGLSRFINTLRLKIEMLERQHDKFRVFKEFLFSKSDDIIKNISHEIIMYRELVYTPASLLYKIYIRLIAHVNLYGHNQVWVAPMLRGTFLYYLNSINTNLVDVADTGKAPALDFSVLERVCSDFLEQVREYHMQLKSGMEISYTTNMELQINMLINLHRSIFSDDGLISKIQYEETTTEFRDVAGNPVTDPGVKFNPLVDYSEYSHFTYVNHANPDGKSSFIIDQGIGAPYGKPLSIVDPRKDQLDNLAHRELIFDLLSEDFAPKNIYVLFEYLLVSIYKKFYEPYGRFYGPLMEGFFNECRELSSSSFSLKNTTDELGGHEKFDMELPFSNKIVDVYRTLYYYRYGRDQSLVENDMTALTKDYVAQMKNSLPLYIFLFKFIIRQAFIHYRLLMNDNRYSGNHKLIPYMGADNAALGLNQDLRSLITEVIGGVDYNEDNLKHIIRRKAAIIGIGEDFNKEPLPLADATFTMTGYGEVAANRDTDKFLGAKTRLSLGSYRLNNTYVDLNGYRSMTEKLTKSIKKLAELPAGTKMNFLNDTIKECKSNYLSLLKFVMSGAFMMSGIIKKYETFLDNLLVKDSRVFNSLDRIYTKYIDSFESHGDLYSYFSGNQRLHSLTPVEAYDFADVHSNVNRGHIAYLMPVRSLFRTCRIEFNAGGANGFTLAGHAALTNILSSAGGTVTFGAVPNLVGNNWVVTDLDKTTDLRFLLKSENNGAGNNSVPPSELKPKINKIKRYNDAALRLEMQRVCCKLENLRTASIVAEPCTLSGLDTAANLNAAALKTAHYGIGWAGGYQKAFNFFGSLISDVTELYIRRNSKEDIGTFVDKYIDEKLNLVFMKDLSSFLSWYFMFVYPIKIECPELKLELRRIRANSGLELSEMSTDGACVHGSGAGVAVGADVAAAALLAGQRNPAVAAGGGMVTNTDEFLVVHYIRIMELAHATIGAVAQNAINAALGNIIVGTIANLGAFLVHAAFADFTPLLNAAFGDHFVGLLGTCPIATAMGATGGGNRAAALRNLTTMFIGAGALPAHDCTTITNSRGGVESFGVFLPHHKDFTDTNDVFNIEQYYNANDFSIIDPRFHFIQLINAIPRMWLCDNGYELFGVAGVNVAPDVAPHLVLTEMSNSYSTRVKYVVDHLNGFRTKFGKIDKYVPSSVVGTGKTTSHLQDLLVQLFHCIFNITNVGGVAAAGPVTLELRYNLVKEKFRTVLKEHYSKALYPKHSRDTLSTPFRTAAHAGIATIFEDARGVLAVDFGLGGLNVPPSIDIGLGVEDMRISHGVMIPSTMQCTQSRVLDMLAALLNGYGNTMLSANAPNQTQLQVLGGYYGLADLAPAAISRREMFSEDTRNSYRHFAIFAKDNLKARRDHLVAVTWDLAVNAAPGAANDISLSTAIYFGISKYRGIIYRYASDPAGANNTCLPATVPPGTLRNSLVPALYAANGNIAAGARNFAFLAAITNYVIDGITPAEIAAVRNMFCPNDGRAYKSILSGFDDELMRIVLKHTLPSARYEKLSKRVTEIENWLMNTATAGSNNLRDWFNLPMDIETHKASLANRFLNYSSIPENPYTPNMFMGIQYELFNEMLTKFDDLSSTEALGVTSTIFSDVFINTLMYFRKFCKENNFTINDVQSTFAILALPIQPIQITTNAGDSDMTLGALPANISRALVMPAKKSMIDLFTLFNKFKSVSARFSNESKIVLNDVGEMTKRIPSIIPRMEIVGNTMPHTDHTYGAKSTATTGTEITEKNIPGIVDINSDPIIDPTEDDLCRECGSECEKSKMLTRARNTIRYASSIYKSLTATFAEVGEIPKYLTFTPYLKDLRNVLNKESQEIAPLSIAIDLIPSLVNTVIHRNNNNYDEANIITNLDEVSMRHGLGLHCSSTKDLESLFRGNKGNVMNSVMLFLLDDKQHTITINDFPWLKNIVETKNKGDILNPSIDKSSFNKFIQQYGTLAKYLYEIEFKQMFANSFGPLNSLASPKYQISMRVINAATDLYQNPFMLYNQNITMKNLKYSLISVLQFYGLENSRTSYVDISKAYFDKLSPTSLSFRESKMMTVPDLITNLELSANVGHLQNYLALNGGDMIPYHNAIYSTRDETIQERVIDNITDVGIFPINIHAMMREIPLANTINNNYSFDIITDWLINHDEAAAQGSAGSSVTLTLAAAGALPVRSSKIDNVAISPTPIIPTNNEAVKKSYIKSIMKNPIKLTFIPILKDPIVGGGAGISDHNLNFINFSFGKRLNICGQDKKLPDPFVSCNTFTAGANNPAIAGGTFTKTPTKYKIIRPDNTVSRVACDNILNLDIGKVKTTVTMTFFGADNGATQAVGGVGNSGIVNTVPANPPSNAGMLPLQRSYYSSFVSDQKSHADNQHHFKFCNPDMYFIKDSSHLINKLTVLRNDTADNIANAASAEILNTNKVTLTVNSISALDGAPGNIDSAHGDNNRYIFAKNMSKSYLYHQTLYEPCWNDIYHGVDKNMMQPLLGLNIYSEVLYNVYQNKFREEMKTTSRYTESSIVEGIPSIYVGLTQ